MSKYDETMEMIRQKTGSAQDDENCYTIRFTSGEIESLSDYFNVYLPSNLQNDDDWDNLKWLYNIMGAWKKIEDAEEARMAKERAANAVKTQPEKDNPFLY